MDQDPEQRIADLERQLAEQKRGADLPPASPDQAAESRRFVAATSRMKTSIYIVGYAAFAACFAPFFPMMFKVPFALEKTTGWVVVILMWVGVGLFGTLAILRWGIYKKIPICVTSDGLTVDQRPGDVFSFTDAKLGPWTLSGTALHLRCGRHRFVLGGEDHRVGTATRLEAPPTGHVDGWLRSGDFDEVLTMVARRSGLDIRGPAPGEPLRCLLFPRPSAGAFDFVRSLKKFNPQPNLAVDVGTDAVWVIDPNTNALIASASLAQVTATPANCKYNSEGGSYTVPVLVARVPGLQTLTIDGPISCAWRGKVPEEKEPEFMVSDADWRVLVEKFGLAPYLAESPEEPGLGPDRG
jgi:hypothetical protein